MNWTHIIFHHTGPDTDNKTFAKIRQEHIDLGWVDIGYNYVVDQQGNIHKGRSLDIPGAHTRGYNKIGIGIVVIGNFDVRPLPEIMFKAVVQITRRIMDEHVIPLDKVKGHRDYTATACPGRYFPMERIKRELEDNGMFTDVPKDAWYYGSVMKASEIGAMSGYPDGTFRPLEKLTRAEFASALMRAIAYAKTQSQGISLEDNLNAIEKEWAGSVVKIEAGASSGSGSFIAPDLLLTNAHVVNGVDKVTVVTDDGVEIAGEVEKRGCIFDKNGNVIWGESGKGLDMATVRLVRATSRKPVVFATTAPDDTDFVLCIGSPLAIRDWKSLGIVSRQTAYYINTDAAINPGNSGGAAFNLKGEFVGMPTYKYVDVSVDNMAGIIKVEPVSLWLAGKVDEIIF